MAKRWEKGTIYFIRFRDGGLVKIGFTRRPKSRLAKLERRFGLFDVLGIIDDVKMIDEVALHKQFDYLHVDPSEADGSCEMFRAGNDLISFIEESADQKGGALLTHYLEKRRWRASRNRRKITDWAARKMREEYHDKRPRIDALADKYRVSERYARKALVGRLHKAAGGPIQESLPDSY